MDNNFFEYCTICRKIIQSPKEWAEHAELHAAKRKSSDTVASDSLPERESIGVQGDGLGGSEDARLAQAQGIRALKKVLKENGIEGYSTMNIKEAQAAYDALVADGRVK